MLVLALSITLVPMAVAATPAQEKAAEKLYELGLFMGIGNDTDGNPAFSLDTGATRVQGIVMLIRLIGAEEEALKGTYACPFEDVQGWAEPYVGYAYAKGLTNGDTGATFNPGGTLTAAHYLAFVLRALGYEDGADFEWSSAWTLTDTLGITNGEYNEENNTLLRGGIAEISLAALYKENVTTGNLLIEDLIAMGVVPESAATDADDTQDTQDTQDSQNAQDSKDNQDNQDSQDTQNSQNTQDTPDTPDTPDTQDTQDNQEEQSYEITVTTTGGAYFGTVTVESDLAPRASQGSRVKLVAEPSLGSVFDHWEVVSGGIAVRNRNSPSTSFTMPDNDVSIRAHFRQAPLFKISVNTSDTAAGYVQYHTDLAPNNAPHAAQGSTVSLTAIALPGYSFAYWEVVSPGYVKISNWTSQNASFTMPDYDVKILAHFRKDDASSLEISANVVSGEGRVAAVMPYPLKKGDVVRLIAKPDPGYRFVRWIIPSDIDLINFDVKSSETTFVMPDKNISISVVFESIK